MRIGAVCVLAAVAFAAAPFTRSAPIVLDSAAGLTTTPEPDSKTFIANRSDMAIRTSSVSHEHRRASTTDETERSIEKLQARGVKETEEMILDKIDKFVKDLDDAHKRIGVPILTSAKPLVFGSSKRKRPAWADKKPELALSVGVLRSKLPKHRNGNPNIDALAAIAPEQRFMSRYLELQALIKDAAQRATRKKQHKSPQPASSGVIVGSKRNQDSPSEADLSAARAIVKSPSFRKHADGRLDAFSLSQEEENTYRAAQRLLRNSKRREKRKSRNLLAQSTPGGAAKETSGQLSTSTNALAPVSSSVPTPQVSSPDLIAKQHHAPSVSTSASHSSSSSPVPTLIEPSIPTRASPSSPPGSPSSLWPWSSFGAPIYSPPRFDPC